MHAYYSYWVIDENVKRYDALSPHEKMKKTLSFAHAHRSILLTNELSRGFDTSEVAWKFGDDPIRILAARARTDKQKNKKKKQTKKRENIDQRSTLGEIELLFVDFHLK